MNNPNIILKGYKASKFLVSIFFVLMFTQMCLAVSDEAINASNSIKQAEQEVVEMIGREIPILRANESLEEAKQIYSAQLALEKTKGKAKYDLVFEYTTEVSYIKSISFRAQDELTVFKEIFASSEKDFDSSSITNEYNEILLSFEEERFEETIELINEGYDILSEVQSSQTALKSFYSVTSRSIKGFFIDNWLKLLVGFLVVFVAFLIFRKGISIYWVRRKMDSLKMQRVVLLDLIKKLQRNYFDKKSISEGEYETKTTKFEEMIRDIDRQIPLLKQEMFKIVKNKTRVKEGNFGRILVKATGFGSGVSEIQKVKKKVSEKKMPIRDKKKVNGEKIVKKKKKKVVKRKKKRK